MDARELDRVLIALEEKDAEPAAAADHQLEISLDELDVELSIDPDA